MTIDETRELLTPIFALDGRRLTPEVVALWHSLLTERTNLQDAKSVAKQWLKNNDGLLKPSHINEGILALRRKRIPDSYRIESEIYRQRVPAELDTPQFRQQLVRRLGDGVQLDKAVTDSMTAVKQIESKPQRETVQYQKPQNARNVSSLANVVREVIG